MSDATNKNAVRCASCGERRDQHGVKTPCPRFVVPPAVPQQALDSAAWTPVAIPGTWRYFVTGGFDPAIPAAPPTLDGLASRLTAALDRIAALEKQLKSYSFDPRIERAARERIDYTQWIDDEDCLTSTERVWPIKPRVVF